MNRFVCLATAFLVVLCSLLMMGVSTSHAGEAPGVRVMGNTIVVNASGGGDYTRIQWAVDNASEGDTVYVEAGMYYEDLVITKKLTLIGAARMNTTIDGTTDDLIRPIIDVLADFVNLRGFHIISDTWGEGINVSSSNETFISDCSSINGSYGVMIDSSHKVTVANSAFSQCKDGIRICDSSHCTIENNTCDSNGYYFGGMDDLAGCGISVFRSNHNWISNNTCCFNMCGFPFDDQACGISVSGSNNIIIDNNCSNNENYGIYIDNSVNCIIVNNTCNNNLNSGIDGSSNENIIEENMCNDNTHGVVLHGSNNLIMKNKCNNNSYLGIETNGNGNVMKNSTCNQNSCGIVLHGSNNLVQNNTFSLNTYGIYLDDFHLNNIINNTLNNNSQDAIYMKDSYSNQIYSNQFHENTRYAVKLDIGTSDNIVHHNNFYGNNGEQEQAEDNGYGNRWNTPNEGNYWSDWTSPDSNGDGVVDQPYNISGPSNVRDIHPLSQPFFGFRPIADAGPDVTIEQHDIVHLNGSGSNGHPFITDYTWSFSYNSTLIQIHGPTNIFTFALAGSYEVLLTVTDSKGYEDADLKMVHVLDIELPRAKAGPDVIIELGQTYFFNGSLSIDNTEIANYTWIFLYDETVIHLYECSTSFTFHTLGQYEVTLNITDTRGNWATDTMNITVRDSYGPIANAGDDVIVNQHELVHFNGSASYDNVEITNYSWTFTINEKEIQLYGVELSFQFDNAGHFQIQLNVSDAVGNWATDTVNVTVLDITPPSADAGGDIAIHAGGTAFFDGSASRDNVAVVNYTWEFVYNHTEYKLYGVGQSFTFAIPDTYNVTLMVRDFEGNQGRDSLTVTVVGKSTPEQPDNGEIDTDEDGYNDTFENASGSNPFDGNSTPLDLDGDGWNNTMEAAAGSDPFNPLSTPIDLDGDTFINTYELASGSDPLNFSSVPTDRDGDGRPNDEDAYPDDPARWEWELEDDDPPDDEDETGGGIGARYVWAGVSLAGVLIAGIIIFLHFWNGRKEDIRDVEGDVDVDGEDKLGRVEVDGEEEEGGGG